jgi:hypothetical protein
MRYKVQEVQGEYWVYDTHNREAEPEKCDSMSEAIAKAAAKSFDLGEQNGKRHPEARTEG